MVKQAVFNILGDIEGLSFLDLFAGTGQVGAMALERGANVIFVEKNAKLGKNLRTKFGDRVYIMDAIRFLELSKECYNIIFADPPYSFEHYDKLIDLSRRKLCNEGVFILEHRKNLVFPSDKRKEYGDTALSIWRKEE